MRHVEHVMGTVFSFDVRHTDAKQAIVRAVTWLHQVDEVFSTYRADSPISRLGRGEIGLADCPPEVIEVLSLCDHAAKASQGYFTTYPHGRLDPSALVKGWAIDRASEILTAAGMVNHCVNGGGDIRLAESASPGQSWRVGVSHPLRPGTLAAVVAGRDLAVATSGTAERGPHIINPHTGGPATELASVTLIGPTLALTDAYATAAFAMGDLAYEWVAGLDGFEAFAVTATGAIWQTPGFPYTPAGAHI